MDKLISCHEQRSLLKGIVMVRVLDSVSNYMQERELLTCVLLTGIFLALSLVAHTRLTITTIESIGQPRSIHIAYYGFPLEMLGIFNPITNDESYFLTQSGVGSLQLLWSGLAVDFAIFFALAFVIVYASRRVSSSLKTQRPA